MRFQYHFLDGIFLYLNAWKTKEISISFTIKVLQIPEHKKWNIFKKKGKQKLGGNDYSIPKMVYL